MPIGSYGRVADKSSLATTFAVGAGVIDWDYRGNIKVLLFNVSYSEITIKKGDPIGQLIVEKIYMPKLVTVPQLPSCTVRGGSGGIHDL